MVRCFELIVVLAVSIVSTARTFIFSQSRLSARWVREHGFGGSSEDHCTTIECEEQISTEGRCL